MSTLNGKPTLSDVTVRAEDVPAFTKYKGKKVPKIYKYSAHLKRFVSNKPLPHPIKLVRRAFHLVGKRVRGRRD